MKGIITKGIGGFYYIDTVDEVFECKARGKFRHDELTPMVGDKVEITVENGKGVIEKIYKRNSELTRPMVSNVSQAFIVFAIKDPDLNMELLNRFILLCEYNNIKPIICINKIDLCEKEEYLYIKDIFKDLGYELLFIKAKEEDNLKPLKKMLKDNVTVLCGPSGSGKSTILNSLIGNYKMETGEVSKKIGRGKHTTRHSELIQIEQGFLLDTPGFSTLDVDIMPKEELQYLFPEFSSYRQCKFNSCLHNKEPGCKVKEALDKGNISKVRYDFYIKTLEEIMGRRKKW
ncbi:ribosome small subunit-dependent GTPase A [Clostridium algidicarnis]|uniref:ribosome small subunit-dependent GTPase A n=1 Tax=Clostridium algidicarnis TaxID=37659 RepID=UPI001C0B32D7|nr:ribosome small subunit-dependent GTPase A [Clostridium algidicarnis]MBU3203201.1 ribosome small subunit-dependent GTPase A [Clostridium algidicarnis]MBU3205505.1 ribosome small subunit-dependent GTPase A [Clostridium algidicarnis]MBU3211355.1 ribosome small subunit-dependent GTPase A [Clostridium algidicarnis]MBU3222137.1 ribosome small subunit-dependent GTPase A [Clostridium algidicarnis]